ncbi:MAG: PEP-CTERM sorting domain-containing protein [Planctomycetales bacterium]|nr:PEP-CTERM sorting domain-containing protein [Planctomycetales bacterium]
MKSVFTAAVVVLTILSGDIAQANILVRVDLQQSVNNNGVLTTDEPTATTQSSSFGSDGTDFWNAVEKSAGALPTQTLKASNAPFGPTVALLDVFGLNFTAGRQGVPEPLRHDMFQATNTSPVPWQVSGLAPNSSYELVLYGGQDVFGSNTVNDTRFELDLDGDTVLDSTTIISYANAAVYFPSVLTDSTGVLRGTFGQVAGNDPGTGSWQGFQLAGPARIPEPSTLIMLAIGLGGVALSQRRRR